MPGLNKKYNHSKLKLIKESQVIGSILLDNGLKTEARSQYTKMLNNVYDCGGNYIQGKKYLSKLGLNVEAQEFIPYVRDEKNIQLTEDSSNSYCDGI